MLYVVRGTLYVVRGMFYFPRSTYRLSYSLAVNQPY